MTPKHTVVRHAALEAAAILGVRPSSTDEQLIAAGVDFHPDPLSAIASETDPVRVRALRAAHLLAGMNLPSPQRCRRMVAFVVADAACPPERRIYREVEPAAPIPQAALIPA